MKEMTNAKMLELFKECIKDKKRQIRKLQHEYLLLKAEEDIIKREFDEADRQVLQSHIFKNERTGEQITDPSDKYRMNDDDFEIFLKLSTVEHCKRGLTDSEGVYTQRGNAHNRVLEKQKEIAAFHRSIFPDTPEFDAVRKAFDSKLYSVETKLFDLFMSI